MIELANKMVVEYLIAEISAATKWKISTDTGLGICMQQYGSTPYCVLLYVAASLYIVFLFFHAVSVESHNQAIQFES